MTRKRLVLHIGYPKTGTSALQAYLSGNAAVLQQAGIDYPYPEPMVSVRDGVCSGNIIQILFREGFADRYRKEYENGPLGGSFVLNAYAGDFFAVLARIAQASPAPTVLYSGEVLATLSHSNWHHLAAFSELFDLHIVAFARDIFDYFLSGWKQNAKMETRLYSASFGDCIAPDGDMIGGMFQGYSELSRSSLRHTLLNYDTFRRDIVGTFFRAAGFSPLANPAFQLEGQSNTSLTTSEAIVATRAAAIFRNHDLAKSLVRIFQKRPNRPPDRLYYSREVHAKMLALHGATLAKMNQVIVGDKLSEGLRDSPSTVEAVEPADVEMLMLAIRQISGVVDPEDAWVPRATVRQKEDAFYDKEGLPFDFDERAYLFHNPDVAAAGVDPRDHYARYGRREMRRYRYA